jgi:hypothetical protein
MQPITTIAGRWRAVASALPEPRVRHDRQAAGATPVEASGHGGRVQGRWRDLRTSVVIALSCLLIYNANGRAITAGDALPSRYLPFAIWRYHTVVLDPVETLTTQGRERTTDWQNPAPNSAFWLLPAPGGHLVSLYSVVLPVLITPLYAPAVAYLHLRGWTDERLERVARIMEKLTASFLAALSASLLYLLLRRRAAPPIAALLTVAYAFGTTTWVISSQALWQHGMAQLLVVGLLLLLTAPCTVPRALAAGVLCGLIAGNRPPDAVLSAALGVYALFWAGRRSAISFVVGAAVPVALVLLYNITVVGAISGGYARVGHADRFFSHDIRSGLAGLLFSPTRGLFVFSPFLLFLVLAWRHRPRAGAEQRLTLAVTAGVVLQVLLYALTDWRGGLSWGPRFLTDLLPLLVWLLVPAAASLRGAGRAAFVTAVGVAISIEAIGAFTYTGVTDVPIVATANGPGKLRPAWDWRNAPFIASPANGLAPAELMRLNRGNLDALEVAGLATNTVTAGQEVVASGWALAGRETPLQVAVALDGAPPVPTRTFSDRADIRAALPGAGHAGWRIPLTTAGLAPGEHRVSVFMWTSEKTEAYFLTRRTLTVRADPRQDDGGASGGGARPAADAESGGARDLDSSFRTAAERIRASQREPGYWLTTYTGVPRFEDSHREMNTYLTSVLVDLLDPVSAASGLDDSIRRAREHLTAQIEAGGLVRYHGLPNAPGIGTLGCAITPDTDDTALVWRIAPDRDRRRLRAALATIEGYRTADGLYRTWLAPRDRYQCLDPGTDPNPADIAIQMHLLQLLAPEQPSAGRALCAALRRQVDQDRIWVYYRRAPLVPILRSAELHDAGCEVNLPEARMGTTVPGQDVWVAVVRLLARMRPSGGQRPEVVEPNSTALDALLRKLADDDFAFVRRSPPLLYHNDLTATVPRYYWSEDAGYALWLRLAHEGAQVGRDLGDAQAR